MIYRYRGNWGNHWLLSFYCPGKVIGYEAKFLLEEKLPRAFAIGKELGIEFRLDRRIVHTAGCLEMPLLPWSFHAMKINLATWKVGRLGRSLYKGSFCVLISDYQLSDLNQWPRFTDIRYHMIFISEYLHVFTLDSGLCSAPTVWRWTSTRRCWWRNGTMWRSASLSWRWQRTSSSWKIPTIPRRWHRAWRPWSFAVFVWMIFWSFDWREIICMYYIYIIKYIVYIYVCII